MESIIENLMNDLRSLPIVNKLKTVMGKRWGISIHFADDKGWLQGVLPGKFFSPFNPICTVICNSNQGFTDRKVSALNVTANVLGSGREYLSICQTGTSIIATPIKIDKQVIGCVYVDGFIFKNSEANQKEKIKQYLKQNIDDNNDLLNQVNGISVLSEADVEFITGLLGALSVQLVDLNIKYKKLVQSTFSIQDADCKESRYGIIGRSPKLIQVFGLIEKLKNTDAPVLITGENGTGKELIASAIHEQSQRKTHSFFAINCGSFNEQLLESELFGHLKGSFTGANSNKKGLLEVASSGTLFLDELGEMPLSMQVKLLRVLQEGTYYPVGSTSEISTKARILCATNRNLSEMMKKGLFRKDLFYRLNVIKIELPSLKERSEDIELLLQYFIKKYFKKNEPILSTAAINALKAYSWPGNIRQLENEILRLSITCSSKEIQIEDLSEDILKGTNLENLNSKVTGQLKNSIEEHEKVLIENGLKKLNGNKSALARDLGISRPTLVKKMQKYGIAS